MQRFESLKGIVEEVFERLNPIEWGVTSSRIRLARWMAINFRCGEVTTCRKVLKKVAECYTLSRSIKPSGK